MDFFTRSTEARLNFIFWVEIKYIFLLELDANFLFNNYYVCIHLKYRKYYSVYINF